MIPHPMNDVLVVIPGIMGSTLYRGDEPVWEPSGGAVLEALNSVFRNITLLRLPDGIGDNHPADGVRPVDLMPDIRLPFGLWTFDRGYSALVDFLSITFNVTKSNPLDLSAPANLITFPYDWRLSNRYNGERLHEIVEPLLERWRSQGGPYADAKLIFICHSMGGLVARWYIDCLGGADVTRKLITIGTPHRGALKALEQLVNGVHKGPGPFKLNLTLFARSLPSLHQLLPEYACIEAAGALAKTSEVIIPELVTNMVTDAMAFHDQIDAARSVTKRCYELHPIVGFEQPTWTTASFDGHRVVPIRTIKTKHDDGKMVDINERGDATVPRLSAAPPDVDSGSAILKYVADNHSGLVHNHAVFDELEGILTANPVRHRASVIRIAVELDEILDPAKPLIVRAALPGGESKALECVVEDKYGNKLNIVRLDGTVDGLHTELNLPGPGVFLVTVRGAGNARAQVGAVTTVVLAWPQETAFELKDLTKQG